MNEEESIGYDDSIEVIARMRQGMRWRFPVEFGTFQVYLRPLTMNEELEAYSETVIFMKNLKPTEKTEFSESNMIAKQILFRASSSQPGAQDSELTHKIMGDMTRQEVLALYKEYLSITDKCDPGLETISGERLEKLVEAIKKNPPETLDLALTELSFSHLKAALIFLVRENLQKASSSGGSPIQ